MIDQDFLTPLRCLETGSRLRLLDEHELTIVNDLIVAGRVTNRLGQTIDRPLSDGLVNEPASWIYPVWNDIPALIRDEAISGELLPADH